MNEKPIMSWLLIWILIGLVFLFTGCAPGDKIIFRPDVYISGNFSPYYPPYYESWYPFKIITIVNGTSYELQIIRDGEKLAGTILSGQHFKLETRVDYQERREVSLVALAYKEKRLAGTAEKKFYFYGNTRSIESETWLIRSWDIRDP